MFDNLNLHRIAYLAFHSESGNVTASEVNELHELLKAYKADYDIRMRQERHCGCRPNECCDICHPPDYIESEQESQGDN